MGIVVFARERKIVLDACRWLSHHGFFGARRGSGGNVSLRLGEGKMAITPSSIPYEEMEEADICIVDWSGSYVDVKEGRKPSIEKALHAAVYETRPEIGACIHTHQIFASVLSVLNLSIPPLLEEVVAELGRVVEVIPYAPCGSEELALKAAKVISNGAFAYILQNHGALLLGESMEKALLRVEILEKVSQVYCLAISTGKPIWTL